MTRGFRGMRGEEYGRTFFPDLVQTLPNDDQAELFDMLGSAMFGGQYLGRAWVQRHVELLLGHITHAQFESAVLIHEPGDISATLRRLSNRNLTPDQRRCVLRLLSHVNDVDELIKQVEHARTGGVLTATEARQVLASSLAAPPLPPLVRQPDDVPALPFTWSFYEPAPDDAHEPVFDLEERLALLTDAGPVAAWFRSWSGSDALWAAHAWRLLRQAGAVPSAEVLAGEPNPPEVLVPLAAPAWLSDAFNDVRDDGCGSVG